MNLPTPANDRLEPLLLSIPDACRVSGLSRSGIYRALATGELQARKHGNRTLIPTKSLRGLVDALPVATFRAAG